MFVGIATNVHTFNNIRIIPPPNYHLLHHRPSSSSTNSVSSGNVFSTFPSRLTEEKEKERWSLIYKSEDEDEENGERKKGVELQ